MSTYAAELAHRIEQARSQASQFFDSLRIPTGYKYTSTHQIESFPAAILYGTWAAVLGASLASNCRGFSSDDKLWALEVLTKHRRPDGVFRPCGLDRIATSKSVEYLVLHCTNYASGAALEIDPNWDFRTTYLDRFLDPDTLAQWLDGRSLARPWEEGNNIVNIASYLALCDKRGISLAKERLYQLLEWHYLWQNPKTGGFDAFSSPSFGQRLQSLAGAVHNFHLHLYLREPLRCEEVIASNLPPYLVMGRLTACLSIDFVELALRTLPFSPDPQLLVDVLLFHAEALLKSQRSDGGWLEAENDSTPTSAAGFSDKVPASCSYATWFRLAALGMIAVVLLKDSPERWGFRKSLGMGYAPDYWPSLPSGVEISPPTWKALAHLRARVLPQQAKSIMIRFAGKFI